MALSWKDLGISLAINGAICICVIFTFNFLRRSQVFQDFYAPKRRLSIPFRFRPPRLPPTWFSWVRPVFTIPDEQFVRCAGMDAYVYVSFLGLCWRLAIILLVFTFIMVLPTNLSGNVVDKQIARQEKFGVSTENCEENSSEDGSGSSGAVQSDPCLTEAAQQAGITFIVTDFDKTALTNIGEGSRLMWVHTVAMWIVMCILMKFLWVHYEEMVKWRILHLSWQRQGDSAHTILVRDIPGITQGTIVGRIYDHFDGFIGMILPKKLREKVDRAMTDGISNVFGGGIQIAKKASDKVNATGRAELFKDHDHTVYLLEGEVPASAKGDNDDDAFANADSIMDPDPGSFTSARDRFSLHVQGPGDAVAGDAGALDAANGDEAQGAPASAPGNTVKSSQEILMKPPTAADTDAKDASPADDSEQQTSVRVPGKANPPSTVAGRRNLINFESRRPNTDFDTWTQAEAAVRAGVSVQELVRREFVRTWNEDEIEYVRAVRNEATLSKAYNAYMKKRTALEDLTDKWTSTLRRKKPVKRKKVKVDPNKYGEEAVARWGDAKKTKVDKMEWSIWELDFLLQRLLHEQELARDTESSAAFVTFHSRQGAASAMGMLSFNEQYWQTTDAPQPYELIWRNLALRSWERSVRGLLTWGVLICFIIFFIPIVGALQSLMNLSAYRSAPGEPDNWIDWLMDAPLLGSIIKAMLPTIALKIVLAIVPYALRALSLFLTRQHAVSCAEFEVMTKYFYFQFFVVFVLVTIIGAMLQGGSNEDESNAVVALINELRDDWQQVFDWLGSSLPQQASVFLLWILTNGLLAKGVTWLRIHGAFISYFLSKLAGTARQKKRCWSQQTFKYGDEVPDDTITMLLMLVFCVIQPWMTVVALLYFTCVYFYSRYDLLYVMRERFQSGGLMWPVMFGQVYFGMIIAIVGLAALLAIKGFAPGPILMIPLLVIVIMFRRAIYNTYEQPMRQLALHCAADLDRADKEYDWMRDLTPDEERQMVAHKWDLDETALGPKSERYTQPSLRVDLAAHQQALADAKRVVEAEEHFRNPDVNEQIILDKLAESPRLAALDHSSDVNEKEDSLATPVFTAGELPTANDNV